MLTVVETPTFARLAQQYWTEEERIAFVSYIAANSDSGDVVPGSGGVRKCAGVTAVVANVAASG